MEDGTTSFRLGDIIKSKRFFLSENNSGDNFGLVYDSDNNRIQVLCLSSQKNNDYLNSIKITVEDLVEGFLPVDYLKITNKTTSLKKESFIKKVGRISTQKIDEILRHMIHNIVEIHYNEFHKTEDFIPGETYIHYAGRVYNAEEIKILVDSALDFWLTEGRFTRKFEEDFAKFMGVEHCILTNSGSSANLLATSALTSPKLRERRLEPGDEVITTACAFPTTVNVIIQNNLIPVFLDVDVGTYNIQANKIEGAISEKTKAIFLAHTLGNPFNLRKVMSLAKKYNLWVIEDNCDAIGSKYNGKITGTFGHIATFSFYPAHHITMGEGGALITSDIQLKRIIRSFKDWGRDCWCEPGSDNTCSKRFQWQLGELPFGYDHKYVYSHIGYNLKVTDMQAAVGVEQLNKLLSFIEIRKRNFKILYDGLKKYEEYFVLPKTEPEAEPSWFGFPLTLREDIGFTRNEIVEYLEANKIATRMLFAGNIIKHPCFEDVNYRIFENLKNTDNIMKSTFWIGLYPSIGSEMTKFILQKFEDFELR